jgi:excisionase family DNA binding protein
MGRAVRGPEVDTSTDADVLPLVEPLLDASSAAALLNVRVSWVRDAAREGKLPCLRVGRHLRFTRVMLEEWLVEQLERPAEGDRRLAGREAVRHVPGETRRVVFRPRTEAALLASLSETPNGRKGVIDNG